MIDELVRYFDLQSERRPAPQRGAVKSVAGGPAKHAPILPQYGAVALGVLADPMIRSYAESETFNFDPWGLLARTGFALVMAILLLPAVYKNAFDPGKPILVQLCALFTSGAGWQSLFQGAAAAATG
jgi:hypothetical protein